MNYSESRLQTVISDDHTMLWNQGKSSLATLSRAYLQKSIIKAIQTVYYYKLYGVRHEN